MLKMNIRAISWKLFTVKWSSLKYQTTNIPKCKQGFVNIKHIFKTREVA